MSICQNIPTKDRTLINTKTRFVYLINTINIIGAYWIDNTTVQSSATTMLPLWLTLHYIVGAESQELYFNFYNGVPCQEIYSSIKL